MEHWIGIERNKSLDFSRLLFCFEYHNHLPFREIEKDMRSVWTNIVASILLILMVGCFLWLIVSRRQAMDNVPQQDQPEMPETVKIATVLPIKLSSSATAIGTVLAPKSVQLRTELVGMVSEVFFSPGKIVEKNQDLVHFDTSVEELQLKSAEAIHRIADSTYRRSEQASDARAISDLELEEAKSSLDQANAEVERLKVMIEKKRLRAPFRARAGLFDIHPGQYLPEGTPITMLQGIDESDPHVHIDFMMSQQVADYLKEGDCISVVSTEEPTKATIIAIDSQADKVTRNVLARAKLENPPDTMQPNDSVRLEMKFGIAVPMVKIPVTALRNAPRGSFVYVAKQDPKDSAKLRAYMRNVTPSVSVGEFVTIEKGLTEGETVVTVGSFKLKDGVLIVLDDEAPSDSESSTNAGAGLSGE
jgi:membrane fusion protein (multidrug efflux system)